MPADPPPFCLHVCGALSERGGAGVAVAVRGLAEGQAALPSRPGTVELLGLRDADYDAAPGSRASASPAPDTAPDAAPTALPSPSLVIHAARFAGPSPPDFSAELVAVLRARVGPRTVIHSHGLWRFPGWAASLAARRTGAPLAISPHGMLRRWAFGHRAWRKAPFHHLVELPLMRRAGCLVAASEDEADEIRERVRGVPVAVVPFGIDPRGFPHPAHPEPPRLMRAAKAIEKRLGDPLDAPWIVFLGRVHPIKAPEMLLRAWGLARGDFPDARLAIAGPVEPAYRRELESLAAESGSAASVRWLGRVEGDEKLALLRRARALVLCSHGENFGFAALEGMACGAPLIASERTPWAGAVERGCGARHRHDAPSLAAAIREALERSPRETREAGLRGRRWVEAEFAREIAATRLFELHRWLRDEIEAPDFVRDS